MEVFFVYLWMQLTSISILFLTVSCLAACMWIAGWLARSETRENTPFYNKVVRVQKGCVGVFAVMGTLFFLLPSQATVAVMVGTHYALKLASSEEGVKVQSLIRKKANEYLDEQLKAPK